MEATETVSTKQAEQQSVDELVRELITLEPPASEFSLIRIARHLWAEPEVAPVIQALVTRPDISIAALRWLMRERSYATFAPLIARAIMERGERSAEDINFIHHELRANNSAGVKELRSTCAAIIASHSNTTVHQLIGIVSDEDTDTNTRSLAEERIRKIRASRDHAITRLITGSF